MTLCERNKMNSKLRRLKLLGIFIGLIVFLANLAGCSKKASINKLPPEPKHVEYGMAGETPKEVIQNYNWTCFDNNKYYEVEK